MPAATPLGGFGQSQRVVCMRLQGINCSTDSPFVLRAQFIVSSVVQQGGVGFVRLLFLMLVSGYCRFEK